MSEPEDRWLTASIDVVGGPSLMSTQTEVAPDPVRRRSLYRGDPGMWSWVLHRITGVAIYFFLLVHILDTALVRLSPEAYNAVIGTYKTPIMNLGEIALVMAIVFHAFNGLRIILIDFWSKGPKYQRAMFWIVMVLWAVAIAGFLPRQLMNLVADFN